MPGYNFGKKKSISIVVVRNIGSYLVSQSLDIEVLLLFFQYNKNVHYYNLGIFIKKKVIKA